MRGTSSMAKAGDAARLERAHLGGARVRLHEADHHRAGLQLLDLLHTQRLHRQDHLGCGEHAGGGVRPGDTLIKRVRERGTHACAALHQNARAFPGELLGHFGTRQTRVSRGVLSRSAPMVTDIHAPRVPGRGGQHVFGNPQSN